MNNIPAVAPPHAITSVRSSTDERENASPVVKRREAGSMDNESIKFLMRYWEYLRQTKNGDIREIKFIQELQKKRRNGELGNDSTEIADSFLNALKKPNR